MPRYLNDLDVFYDPSQQHGFSSAFDEGKPGTYSIRSNTVTGSLDTSAIDAFTQGVELTQLKRHDAGLVKIWSGQAGHELLVTWYGDSGPSITKPYSDVESTYFTDPSSIIRNNPSFPILTFPLQSTTLGNNFKSISYNTRKVLTPCGTTLYRTEQDVLAVVMNGIIEPIAIRLKPSFYSSDVPIDVHRVRGSVGEGNSAIDGSTDQILTVDHYHKKLSIAPFIDVTFNSVKFQTSLGAFKDARYDRNAEDPTSGRPPNIDNDWKLHAALSMMTGSTDNYIGIDQRSATCGWYYDNNVNAGTNSIVGTDSVAFGGMTYFNS